MVIIGGEPLWQQGMRVAGHVMALGSCAGSFWLPAKKVTLRVGEMIDIHMTYESAGPVADVTVIP